MQIYVVCIFRHTPLEKIAHERHQKCLDFCDTHKATTKRGTLDYKFNASEQSNSIHI